MKNQAELQRSNLNRGYTIAVISAVILSTTAILIRHLTQTYNIPPLVLAFWRDGFVAIALLPILGLAYPLLLHVNRQHLRYLSAYGLILAIFNAVWTLSVALNGAAISTVLVYCSTGFTALLGWWLLHESLDWVKLGAVVVCMGGGILVSEALDLRAWGTNTIGIITGIFSGLGYAAYTLMGRSASQRGLNPWTTVFYTFGFAALFLLLFNLCLGGLIPGTVSQPVDFLWLRTSWVGWAILFLLAAGPTLTGFGLYNLSLSYLPSSVGNLILTLEPVFTVIIARLLLGETLKGIQIAGSIMILGGVAFLRISEEILGNSNPNLEKNVYKKN